LPSTRFHWIQSPSLSSLSQVCPLTVTASRLASVTPQLLCIDLLRLSHSLSAVSPTSSRWLHLSTHLITLLRLSFELLTLSSPFRRLSHAVSASPPTCRKCLHFLRLSPPLSHEHPTNFAFSDTFSLHVCFTFGKKNLLHITSAHVTMTSVSFKKRKKKIKKGCHVSHVKIEFEFYVRISFSLSNSVEKVHSNYRFINYI